MVIRNYGGNIDSGAGRPADNNQKVTREGSSQFVIKPELVEKEYLDGQ